MNSSEAYELLRFSQQFLTRLKHVQEDPASQRGLAHEKEWLSSATRLLEQFESDTAAILDQAFGLPELQEARADLADERRCEWVETLERLLAGFTFHASRRAPVVEALFPHQKFEQLARREEAARDYAAELERRLKTGYVSRMLGQEEFAFAKPVLEQLEAARARWLSCDEPTPVEGHPAEVVREQLAALADRVQLAVRQAKLLAEAALAAVPNAFHDAGLDLKPKKRVQAAPSAAPPAPPAEERPPKAERPAGKRSKATRNEGRTDISAKA